MTAGAAVPPTDEVEATSATPETAQSPRRPELGAGGSRRALVAVANDIVLAVMTAVYATDGDASSAPVAASAPSPNPALRALRIPAAARV